MNQLCQFDTETLRLVCIKLEARHSKDKLRWVKWMLTQQQQ